MPITQYNSSVRQMSQSKFNSMKNASGKIPDLANQIVMTNSEDTNISCLRTEVVYDMTSSDASKNWGYTGGIQGGVTVTGKDFSKYKKLILSVRCAYSSFTYIISLENVNALMSNDLAGYSYSGSGQGQGATENTHISISTTFISTDKTKLYHKFIGRYFIGSTNPYIESDNNSSYCITNIEGVLKEPSMIYTGDELFAGNGITINNGTIGITPAQQVALNTTRTGQNDTVVEYYMSSDGKTWYRKWASGWKECGMEIAYSGSISANSMKYLTPTLPVTFSNNYYTIQLTGLYGGTASGKVIWTVESPDTNKFLAGVMGVGISVTNPKCKIYCCGF